MVRRHSPSLKISEPHPQDSEYDAGSLQNHPSRPTRTPPKRYTYDFWVSLLPELYRLWYRVVGFQSFVDHFSPPQADVVRWIVALRIFFGVCENQQAKQRPHATAWMARLLTIEQKMLTFQNFISLNNYLRSSHREICFCCHHPFIVKCDSHRVCSACCWLSGMWLSRYF